MIDFSTSDLPLPDAPVLEGTLLHVQHRKDSGWAIVTIKPHHTVVGTFTQEPVIGSRLIAHGKWTEHKTFGRQFIADSIELYPPTADDDLRAYLAKAVAGVGAKTAEKLVAQFGAETAAALNDPQRLIAEANIRPDLAERMSESWISLAQEREVLAFLRSIGIATGLARRVIAAFGFVELIPTVKANPYKLADIHGIGFASADSAARYLSITADAPKRIRAGLKHALVQRAESGHTMTTLNTLVSQCAELLSLPESLVASHVSEAAFDGVINERMGAIRGEVLYCLPRLDGAEQSIARDVFRLSSIAPSDIEIPTIAEIKEEFNFEPDPSQYQAICTALTEPVSIITGGPGTGKTTILRIIISLFRRLVESDALVCSPTGRAAKRVTESTGEPASTIHRLLGVNSKDGDWRFAANRQNQLGTKGWLHIIDETSMVDVKLAASLLEAIPTGSRLLIMGDPDQLPSIGPGNVLADLIAGNLPTTHLTTLHRTAAGSQIALTARSILTGRPPVLNNQGEVRGIRGHDAGDVLAVVQQMLSEGTTLEEIGIISPMRKGPMGTEAINFALQEALNGAALAHRSVQSQRSVLMPNGTERHEQFAIGDRVMQVNKNNYDLDVYNGDIFVVIDIPQTTNEKWLDLRRLDDNATVRIPTEHLVDIQLAYCWTVHKSQGTQYPHVVIALSQTHRRMLNQRLLFTAWTRAMLSNTIVGDSRAISMACDNVGGVPLRDTGLSILLRRYMKRASVAAA